METSIGCRLAANAPKNHIIRRMLEEKTISKETGQRCIYKKVDLSMSLLNKFTILSRGSAMGILAVFNAFKQNSIAWISSESLYSTNLFFYLRKGAPDGKHFKRM